MQLWCVITSMVVTPVQFVHHFYPAYSSSPVQVAMNRIKKFVTLVTAQTVDHRAFCCPVCCLTGGKPKHDD